MDEILCRRVLEDAEATTDQIRKALCTIDLRDLEQIILCRATTYGYYARHGRARSAWRVGLAMLDAERRFERACRFAFQLRQRLAAAEAHEAAVAKHPPPAGLFISGHSLVVSAGDADATTVSFTLTSDEFRALAEACRRAADRLEGRVADPVATAEAVTVGAQA